MNYECSFEGCGYLALTDRGRKIHERSHSRMSRGCPDLIGMGIVKRRLTEEESKQITKEVMQSGFKDADTRFTMAMMKAIEVTNAKP